MHDLPQITSDTCYRVYAILIMLRTKHLNMSKSKPWSNFSCSDQANNQDPQPSRNVSSKKNIFLELDVDILEKISYQAEGRGITITSYIDQIIKKYLEQDRFKPKTGTVMLSAPVAKELFDNLTRRDIIYSKKHC